ncbi:MAG TPA: uroporphyrinogen-III synthase, partial [Ignavibacteriaceae bacterium]|nr:uroporphyrinogen-III synthase [Ignavibacteriaceae bacterium]
MNLPSKKESNKQIKRKKIIESASKLFSTKSYHEVMMEDVAKQASIAKGTVYNYFETKEDLYFSIMQMRMENLVQSLRNKVQYEMSSIDSLHSFIIHLYMFMMKYQSFFLMYQKENLKTDHKLCDELCRLEDELKNILNDIIKSGRTENLFREIEECFAVDLILGSIYGAIYRGIENNYSEPEMVKDREKIFDFVLHGLFTSLDKDKILPLKGKTIAITRTVEQSRESAEAFIQLGAKVIIFPTLDIVPPDSWKEFDDVVLKEKKIDFIIFTSAHAVKMFNSRCNELNIKLSFQKTKIVAVGNKTAAVCERQGLPVNIIPSKFSGEGVINELSKYDLEGKVIFIPQSAIGRQELPEGLEEQGAVIKVAPAYNVALPDKDTIKDRLDELNNNNPDLFIFTSPSTFKNYLQILDITNPNQYFSGYDIAAIGPTTRAAIENRNVRVTIMPDEYTING